MCGHAVTYSPEWQLLAIGCQVHSVRHWRAHWQSIAADHDVTVSEVQAAALLARLQTPRGD